MIFPQERDHIKSEELNKSPRIFERPKQQGVILAPLMNLSFLYDIYFVV